MNRFGFAIAGIVLSAGASSSALAQVYIATQSSATYTPIPGGTVINYNDVDEGDIAVPIGFPFVFYGVTYDHVNIAVNGAITFAAPCVQGGTDCSDVEFCNIDSVCERDSLDYFTTIPDPASPNAMIAPFLGNEYVDNFFTPPSIIRYTTTGSAPNRVFKVEWANIRASFIFFGGTVANTSFQVSLFETTGAIRMNYGTYNASGFDDNEWSGVIGLENTDGTDAVLPISCGTGCLFGTLQALQNQQIEFIAPNTPELIGTVTPPTGADPGDEINIAVQVRNIGPQPTGSPFTANVYLSSDTTITPGTDTFLGTLSYPALDATSNDTETLTVALSSTLAPGLYHIGAIIDPDNLVAEALETNNIAVSGTFLVGADASIAIDPIPGTGPNERVSFPLRLINNGSALANVEWAVYFSTDQNFDMSDTLIATGSSPLPAVPLTTITVTATVPTMIPGDYYAIAVIDPNNLVMEADETNNIAAAGSITQLRGADVVAASVTGGNFAFRGETYHVDVSIRNDGLSTASNFYYSVHLSTNQLITFSDPLLGELGPITVGPGQRYDVSLDLAVSSTLAPGLYYLGLIADSTSQVLEQLENNNVTHQREQVTVRDPAPDFTASGIVLPATGAAGESLTIERIISNAGNAPATAPYKIFLSADGVLDPAADLEITSSTLMLASRADDRGIDRVRIPSSTPGGRYYVAYQLDPMNTVAELYEDNNVAVSNNTIDVLASQLMILTRTLPPATVDLPYEFVFAAAGGAGGYSWSISAGMLPNGLTLDPSGRLNGTPAELGMFSFTVSVSDGSLAVSDDIMLLVAEQTLPLEIVTRSVVPSFVGRPYVYPLTAFGGVPPYVWTARDALPAGLSFSADGIISGTPAMPDVKTVNFHVSDAMGTGADRPITVRAINGDDSVRFSNDVLPDGTLGEQYMESVKVEPGTGASPFHFQLSSGALPPGLTLENDQVLGVPTMTGDFSFEVRLTDSRGDFDVNLFVITIREATGVNISTTSLPPGITGTPYTEEGGNTVRVKAFSANMTGAISFSILSGALPPGLTLAMDGAITGTPSQGGVYSFLIEAKDGAGQTDHRALGILINEPPPVKTSSSSSSGCSCGVASEERSGAGALGAASILVLLGVALFAARRRLAALLLLLALIGTSGVAQAQTAIPYFLSSRSEAYTARSGGTQLSFASLDDDVTSVTLPFPFHFFDQDYTAMIVGTNGAVSFDPATTFIGTFAEPIPTPGEPDAMIAAWWDDLLIDGVTTYVEGTAPSRVFIVQWDGVHHFASPAGEAVFQLWLYEGLGGHFELHYGATAGITTTDWTGESGFEDATGSTGFYFFSCAAGCSGSDLIAANGTVYIAQQDAGEDIIAQAITAPSVVYPGIAFDLHTTVASLHQMPLGPFVYEAQLLAEGQSPPGITIFRSAPTTLTPYQTLATVTSTAIPLSTVPGRYRLALVVDADHQVMEPDEANNVIISTSDFRVDPRRPDFTIAGVDASTMSAAPGAQVTFTLDLSNRGNLDGTTAWGVYLSRNSVVSTDDVELQSGTEALPLLTTAHLTVPVTLPNTLTAGVYYVGAIADADNLVSELSEVNNTGSSANRLVIRVGAVSVATSSLPRGYQGVTYSTFLEGSGGDGTYAWSITQGSLPTGLALIPTTGEIRGRPTGSGTSQITVQVSSGGDTATADLSLEIDRIEGALTIVTHELLPGIVGDAYPPADVDTAPAQQQHLVAVGGNATATVTFSIMGAPPPGLTLDEDGYLHGVPTTQGVFQLTIAASDGTMTAMRTIPLTIAEPGRLTLVAALLPDAAIGQDYEYQLSAIGQSPTSTISFDSDPLPMGLTLTRAGLITGIPTMVGTTVFSVTVTEGSGPNPPKDSANYRIDVVSDAGFRITPTSVPGGVVGTDYDVTFEAVGGMKPFIWRILGPPLPRGLVTEIQMSDTGEKLEVKGNPEIEAFVSELVTVSDAAERHAEVPISFQITAKPAPVIPKDSGGCSCATARGPAGDAGLFFGLVLAFIVSRSRRRPR